MALCKTDFIMDQNGRKSELPDKIRSKPPSSNVNRICEMVCHAEVVNFWYYLNLLLTRIAVDGAATA